MTDTNPATQVPLSEQMEEGILEYTKFVSEDRAIPSILDGFKPVQRRLLWQAYNDNLKPVSQGGKHKKSITLVAGALGGYHPHGDVACYGGLVTVTSSSVCRNPLFDDFQGNWGDPSFNDGAAAMRYTEVTMSELGMALTADAEFLDMVPNFDGTKQEPISFCPPIPTALLNDNIGIASGMDTAIPSHNIGNICDVALAFVKNNNCRDQTLLDAIVAPDHVSGGNLLDYDENRAGIRGLYLDGKGSFWYSTKWTIEPSTREGWKHMVKVTSLVPDLKGHTLVYGGWFAGLQEKGDCELQDLCEGSQSIDVRIHFNNPNVAIKGILPLLQDFKIAYRFNVLDFEQNADGTLSEKVPVNTTLRYLLSRWLTYRREIVARRLSAHIEASQWRLDQLNVQRFLANNRQVAIALFDCSTEAEVIALMSPHGFSEAQAVYGWGLSLRMLSRISEDALVKSLSNEVTKLAALEAQAADIDGTIATEIKEFKKRFGQDARRVTVFEPVQYPELVEESQLVAVTSEWGLSVQNSWPAQGKGMGKTIAGAFAGAGQVPLVTVLLENQKVISKDPHDWVGFNEYVFGVSTDMDKYIAVLDNQGDVYIRVVPEGGFTKITKVCKGYPVAMVGLKAGEGLVIPLSGGDSFHYLSETDIAARAVDGMKSAQSIWWAEDNTGDRLIRVPRGADVVNARGAVIDLNQFGPDEAVPCGGPVRVIGQNNLVTYASGRASMLTYDGVYNTLSTVADCYPVEGKFSTGS